MAAAFKFALMCQYWRFIQTHSSREWQPLKVQHLCGTLDQLMGLAVLANGNDIMNGLVSLLSKVLQVSVK